MDAIGFLCVSLGSSTVQLHDILGSRSTCACSEAGFSTQNGERAWGVYYWRVAFYCVFLWEKWLNAKDIHKEMLPTYGGKCLSRKAVHIWVTNVSLMTKRLKRMCVSGWGNNEKTSMLWVSTHWYSNGTSISMLVEDILRNTSNAFLRFEYHMFWVLYPFVSYLLILPRNLV
jgi:hypothetical protein